MFQVTQQNEMCHFKRAALAMQNAIQTTQSFNIRTATAHAIPIRAQHNACSRYSTIPSTIHTHNLICNKRPCSAGNEPVLRCPLS